MGIERCNYESCKKKIHLINFECSLCSKTFCLKHRHTFDHNCECYMKNEPFDKTKNINLCENMRCVKPKLEKI
jgi:hypothetical protein